MLRHLSLAKLPVAIPVQGRPPPQLSAAENALLEMADPSPDCRVTLIGPGTLDLLCALLRRGSIDVCAMRVCDWPKAGTADVAIIANVGSPDHLKRSVAYARRVLAPLGTVAIRLAAGPASPLTRQAGQLLLLHGFTGLCKADATGGTVLRAELPLHGRLACA